MCGSLLSHGMLDFASNFPSRGSKDIYFLPKKIQVFQMLSHNFFQFWFLVHCLFSIVCWIEKWFPVTNLTLHSKKLETKHWMTFLFSKTNQDFNIVRMLLVLKNAIYIMFLPPRLFRQIMYIHVKAFPHINLNVYMAECNSRSCIRDLIWVIFKLHVFN